MHANYLERRFFAESMMLEEKYLSMFEEFYSCKLLGM